MGSLEVLDEVLTGICERIVLNPTEQQRQSFEAATFAENEVYGIDILVASTDDGKVKIPVLVAKFI